MIDALECGSGPALVLLHGIGSRAFSWRAQLDAWSAAHRVIAWDAPGYGRSDLLATSAPGVDAYVDALSGLLADRGVDRFVLVGHSLGALVAAAFAATHPQRVEALVLASVASGYGALPPDERERAERTRAQDRIALGPEGFSHKRSAVVLSRQASPEALERVREAMASIAEQAYLAALHMLYATDIFTFTARIAAPTLVVCGTADEATPIARNRQVAEAIAGARFASIEGAGHVTYVECPAEFNAIVGRFISTGRHA